jgi:branched-chain amino acid transport system permease protein
LSELIQLIVGGLVNGCVYGIVGMTVALIINTKKVFHIAHGGVFLFAGFIAWALIYKMGLYLWISVILAIIGTGLVGMLIELLVYRPVSRVSSSPLSGLLASIGVMYILQSVMSLIFGTYPKIIKVNVYYSLGDINFTNVYIASVASFIICCVIVYFYLNKTKLGILTKAVCENPRLSKIWGIDSRTIEFSVMAIGSALLGIAALLQTADIGITAYAGWNVILIAMMAYLIGGMGSVFGPAVVGLGLGIVQGIIPWKIPNIWTPFILFAIIFAFMVVCRRGLLGRKIWAHEV